MKRLEDKTIFKLNEKDEATNKIPAEGWVPPAASTQEPEEREVVVDSRTSMHMVSEKDLHSAELDTMRTSRSPTDADDAQRRGANKKRSHGKCQRIGITSDSHVS